MAEKQSSGQSRLADILNRSQDELLDEWMAAQQSDGQTRRDDLIGQNEVREQCREFLATIGSVIATGGADVRAAAWEPAREQVASIARTRTTQGFTPSEIATFIFSFKQPLFSRLRAEITDAKSLGDEIWRATQIIDGLGLHALDAFHAAREELIRRQQQEMLELSTPVVKLWEGVLALPMIGTLDSARTQVVMESMLQRIVETGSDIAILDITGVPTVDTHVAQHLLKTVTAARLMGADCIISGIRPQIAQTIVHLGVDLKDITTKATLADAFAVAMKRKNLKVVRTNNNGNDDRDSGQSPSRETSRG